MSEYETRVIEVMVNKKGEQVFSDHATRVRIVDESAGEFVEIDQMGVKVFNRIEDAIDGADVVMMLRIQLEREKQKA